MVLHVCQCMYVWLKVIWECVCVHVYIRVQHLCVVGKPLKICLGAVYFANDLEDFTLNSIQIQFANEKNTFPCYLFLYVWNISKFSGKASENLLDNMCQNSNKRKTNIVDQLLKWHELYLNPVSGSSGCCLTVLTFRPKKKN